MSFDVKREAKASILGGSIPFLQCENLKLYVLRHTENPVKNTSSRTTSRIKLVSAIATVIAHHLRINTFTGHIADKVYRIQDKLKRALKLSTVNSERDFAINI